MDKDNKVLVEYNGEIVEGELLESEPFVTQSRWKSPIVWGAIAAQVLALLAALGWLDVGQTDAVNTVSAAVLQLLVVFGVLNNPTDKAGF